MVRLICAFLVLLVLASCGGNHAQIQQERKTQADHERFYQVYNEQTQPNFQLQLEELVERWNALSEDRGNGLIMDRKKIQYTPEKYQLNYTFPEGIILEGEYDDQGNIFLLEAFGPATSEKKRFALLNAWAQVILITNPLINETDVDEIFAELGVGPNANLSALFNQRVQRKGIYYIVSKRENGYVLSTMLEWR